MAEVEFHLHNEVGIKFPPLRPAYSDGELFFGRFRGLVARSTGTSSIGEGGTGRIHLVRDELMEREVALKIPLESIQRDPAAREDVIQETRQAMDLTHPNIVRIHDFHEADGKWGISMQYVRGKNLDEWRYEAENSGFRRAIRPYTVEAIRDWIAQLCDALRYAHEDARMVHRDIKPKNLMLEKRDGGEKIYITDFGISQRLRQHTLTLSRDQNKAGESKANTGTLPYMPWEQIAGAPASPLDDIYAVGATIYELITGRPPFYDGGFEQIKVQIRETPPPTMEQRILDLGLHIPPPPDVWEEVAAACLAKRPEDRPQSMRAVAAALGFQSGSNTQLEVKVSSQAERINELENQIIILSHSTVPETPAADSEAASQLAEARQQLTALQQQIDQSQANVKRLEEGLTAALTAKQAAELAVQNASRDAEKATQSTMEKLRREAEQAGEQLRKAEDDKQKALKQAHDEAEKRLQKQAAELEKTRQGLAKLAQQKEALERAVATEQAGQGGSLRPMLVGLLVAMALGLGVGFAWPMLTAAKPGLIDNGYLPTKAGEVANSPVPYALFDQFAKAMGASVKELGGAEGAGKEIDGVRGVTAMNFCNWLTERARQEKKLAANLHYTLPDIGKLQGVVGEGTKEWSGTWAADRPGQVLQMLGRKDGKDAAYSVHVLQREEDFSFRITLESLPEPEKTGDAAGK